MMHEELFSKGFYVGNVREIMPLSVLDQVSLDAYDFLQNKEKYFSVRSSTNNSELPQQIPYNNKSDRKKLIKDLNLDLFQEWSEITHYDAHYNKVIYQLRNYIKPFITKIYPILTDSSMFYNDSITLYENGDFIRMHQDGKNIGRLCVLLLYLSDRNKNSYNGGELIIEESPHTFVKVPPYKGTFVILDFTKNNIRHAVEKVINNFERLCYISFIYDEKIKKEET